MFEKDELCRIEENSEEPQKEPEINTRTTQIAEPSLTEAAFRSAFLPYFPDNGAFSHL